MTHHFLVVRPSWPRAAAIGLNGARFEFPPISPTSATKSANHSKSSATSASSLSSAPVHPEGS
jgi:hypothetical protein